MFNRFYVSFFILCVFSSNVLAVKGDNPFAKNESLNIGTDVSWKIDKRTVVATKTASDESGLYYHLQFDNKQLGVVISSDAAGISPKKYSQLEIKNVSIDGKQSAIFKWCLVNQERHSRFLQQDLTVKNNVCIVDGDAGSFIMRLNKEALLSLQKGSRLSIMLKPFRTPLVLNYDISDFRDMYLALNARPEPVVTAVAPVKAALAKPEKKCWAGPPAKYSSIKSVEYDCNDAVAKKDAENWVTRLVKQEKVKEQQLAEAKEKKRMLAVEKKQDTLAEKIKMEEKLQAEAAIIAASVAKQAKINDEITQKMLKVCEKYWSKGEHRCYCQKYIDKAPGEIQASSTCK